ncbi:MAG: hypothetical protein WCD76_13685 [Pyrinomonadaceae bacterium]
MSQQTLFEQNRASGTVNVERVVLYALGDFQMRGKLLSERELPLDRLRGALRRAAEKLAVEELSDELAATTLDALGARVRRVPSFFAKHPYRVTVPASLATRARDFVQALAGRTE